MADLGKRKRSMEYSSAELPTSPTSETSPTQKKIRQLESTFEEFQQRSIKMDQRLDQTIKLLQLLVKQKRKEEKKEKIPLQKIEFHDNIPKKADNFNSLAEETQISIAQWIKTSLFSIPRLTYKGTVAIGSLAFNVINYLLKPFKWGCVKVIQTFSIDPFKWRLAPTTICGMFIFASLGSFLFIGNSVSMLLYGETLPHLIIPYIRSLILSFVNYIFKILADYVIKYAKELGGFALELINAIDQHIGLVKLLKSLLDMDALLNILADQLANLRISAADVLQATANQLFNIAESATYGIVYAGSSVLYLMEPVINMLSGATNQALLEASTANQALLGIGTANQVLLAPY